MKAIKLKSVVLLAAVLLAPSFFCSLSCKGKSARPNVIIVTLDTTRADHIGCYGNNNIETPVMDRLAKEGVRFDRLYASAPITLPNHASILTGTHPAFHGARNNGTFKVDESITTAAEIFKNRGYQTAGFIASFPLLARFGLDQGFDVYDDRIEEGKEKRTFLFQERRAEDVNRAVFNWLDKRQDGPFFVWVHYFDPHFSYEAPSPYREKYFFEPYDGEIAYADAQLGELLSRFREKGLLENAIVVVTADHGESLGEHKEKTHAILIYYATVQVPLIIWAPGILPAGQVEEDLVRSIDILPTVLDYADIEVPSDVQGVSLRPLIEDREDSLDLIAYTETLAPFLHFHWTPLESVRTNEWLYIHAEPEELYNLKNDPKELDNLADAEPKTLARTRDIFKKEKNAIQNPSPVDGTIRMDAETQDRLRALGYIQSATVAPDPDERLPNPRDLVGNLEIFYKGQSAMTAEQYEAAIEIFDSVLEKDPNFGRAHLEKGFCYFKMGELDKALECYNLAEKFLPTPETYMGRAQVFLSLKKKDEAKKDLETTMEMDPSHSASRILMAKLYLTEKNVKDAYRLLLEAVKANPRSEVAHYELGRFYKVTGNPIEAKNEFLEARDANPNFAQAAYELGSLQIDGGESEEGLKNLQLAVQRNPKFSPAHARMAQYYLDQDQLTRAESHIEVALAIDPSSAEAHFVNGNLLIKKGNLPGAYAEFTEAVKENPRHALAHKNLGSILAIMGDSEKSILHYKLSLELAPNQPMAEKIKAALKEMGADPSTPAAPETSIIPPADSMEGLPEDQ